MSQRITYVDHKEARAAITSMRLAGKFKCLFTLLHDEHGWIVDPDNMKYKCGWGKTIPEAAEHFSTRNPVIFGSESQLLVR